MRELIERRWAQSAFGWFTILLLSGCATSNSVVNFSHYDLREPDFAAMKRQGVVGVIHEATFPRFDQDHSYAARESAASDAGLLWGAYHFGDASDPIQQADHFLGFIRASAQLCGGVAEKSGVLPVLDFEDNTHYPGGTMRVTQAVAFIERIHERTGIYPGLYSNENRVRTILNSSCVDEASRRTLQHCWLWIANYHTQPRATRPWRGWQLWQYTGDGVCGLPRSRYPISIANFRNAERDIFRGSEEDLVKFWETHSWHPG